MLFAKDFRRIAKERLASYWLPNIGFLLLYMLLNGATGATVVGWILLAGPVEYGFYSYYLEQVRGLHPTVGTMFDAFSTCFGTSIALFLLKGIFTFLWSLLLFVPGIIKGYSYSMATYILHDCPTLDALEALDHSRAMMDGNKWRLFCLDLSFIGWLLLCAVTFGIAGLYVIPYMQTSRAAFYEEVRAEYVAKKPEFAYHLNN